MKQVIEKMREDNDLKNLDAEELQDKLWEVMQKNLHTKYQKDVLSFLEMNYLKNK